MTIQATLFDMDGLLIDSEVLWHEAELEIFGALGVYLGEATNRSTKVSSSMKWWSTGTSATPGQDRASPRW